MVSAVMWGTTSLAAEEPVKNKDVAAGMALIDKGEYGQAAQLMRETLAKTPDDPEASLCLGKALNRMGEKEAATHLKSALRQNPENPEVSLELGIFFFNKDLYAEAEDYFDDTISLAPDSDPARKAREFLVRISEKRKDRTWEISALSGLQFDSNVILNGNGVALPAGISGESDWSGVVNVKGHYRFLKVNKFEMTAGYSFYQNLHFKLSDFNVTQNLVDLSAAYELTSNIKLKASYGFEYLQLAGQRFDHAHTLAPTMIFKCGNWGTSSIDYRFRNAEYRDTTLFTNNSQRTGNNHYFGINHIMPIGKTFVAWGVYSHDEDLTRNSFWDYHGDRLLAGLRAVLPFSMTADIYGEYYKRRYGAVDPSYGVKRDDDQTSASISLTRHFTENISVVLAQLYTRNFSNIQAYDYERFITSLFLNVRFYE